MIRMLVTVIAEAGGVPADNYIRAGKAACRYS